MTTPEWEKKSSKVSFAVNENVKTGARQYFWTSVMDFLISHRYNSLQSIFNTILLKIFVIYCHSRTVALNNIGCPPESKIASFHRPSGRKSFRQQRYFGPNLRKTSEVNAKQYQNQIGPALSWAAQKWTIS